MNLNSVMAMLGQAAAPATQQDPRGQMMFQISLFVILGFVFYWITIRPQQKKAKELSAMLKNVKAGDQIITNSGIVGIVLSVKDKTLTLRTAETKIEILKSAIAEIQRSSASESSPS